MTSGNIGPGHEQQVRMGTLDVLNGYEASRQSIRSLLRAYRAENDIDTRTMAGIEFLSIGVIRYLNTIDFYLSRGSGTRNLKELPPPSRNLLRIAIYQKFWLDTPFSTITEYLSKSGAQYILIMKRIAKVDLSKAIRRFPLEERMSVSYSHPTFLVKTILDNLGQEEAIELLSENNNGSSTYVRPNKLLASSKIMSVVSEIDGVDIEEDSEFPGIYRIRSGLEKIVKSEPFTSSRILIQDKASFLTANVLNPLPGEFVWDACAAPGMKTQLLWELMNSEGQLVATEVNTKRYQIGKERSAVLGLQDVDWRLEDASRNPVLGADKILIDAPCSSTGMLRSHPSFKWRLNKKNLFSIMTIQNKILEGILSAYSDSPGTEIVYATCSILPHEGESQIDSILDRYNVDLVDIPEIKRTGYPEFKCSDKVRRMFPHIHLTDGFFISKMRITH